MNLLIWLVIGALLRACWHISKFRPQMSWIPEWDYPFGIKRPPLDSFHIYGGLFTLWMITVFFIKPDVITINFTTSYLLLLASHVTAYWVIFFWYFSLFYHVILIKPGYRQWSYLIPIIK